jgi:hypothetical protein
MERAFAFVGRESDVRVALCQCGCGGFAPIARNSEARRGYVRGEQKKFIQGHGRNVDRAHGHAKSKAHGNTPTYQCWAQMLQRCKNPKLKNYKDYGGRGISVCERWHDFRNFLADMGEKPQNPPGLSINRIDGDGNYEPANCHWATDEQQNRNRRTQFGDQDHCKHGHLLAGDNVYMSNGRRVCRACHRERERERRRKREG